MPRREVAPPALPQVPFTDLSAADQARCIAWNLRVARKRAGFTLPTFAAHMREVAPEEAVSLSYLGDIERGDRTPSLTTVLALARALRIDARVLFGMAGELRATQPGAGAALVLDADAA